MKIPLRHVRLPTADSIYAYLQEIDKNNWYTNRGKLVEDFERRLAEHFSLKPTQITVVNNATSGLSLALLASGAKTGTACIMPSLSFAACPSAALAAGLTPMFADVDPATLTLTPQTIEPVVEKIGGHDGVGAIMPVSLYGAPVDHQGWKDFKDKTGIPVIYDAAWCFDPLRQSELPSVISLHATKACGIGEGGIVIASSEKLIEHVRRGANFGFDTNRSVVHAGLNAKLSEYAAAVGLASLDEWQTQRNGLIEKAKLYASLIKNVPGIKIANAVNGTWAPATVLVKFSKPSADEVSKHLADEGVESRHWWGGLLSEQPAMAAFESADLRHSKDAILKILNLPFSMELDSQTIERIVNRIAFVLGHHDASND